MAPLAALVLLAAAGATFGRAATAGCPAAPKAIPRPAMLGAAFPTPRGYFYTSAKRRNGAAIISGYSNQDMRGAWASWTSVVVGGRFTDQWHEGKTHSEIFFKSRIGKEHGRVDLYATCRKRVTAVITDYAG